jgi:hypothetical protein
MRAKALASQGVFMKRVCRAALLLVLASHFVASCSSGPSTSIKQVTRAASIENAPYANVLVIAVAKSPSNARRFENELAGQLRSSATTATPSHTERADAALTEAQVKEIVEKVQADAIIVTSVKRADVGTAVEKSRVEVAKTRKSNTLVDFFRYDYKEVTTPEIVTLSYQVELTTDVYDAVTGGKVYTIESRTIDAETSFDVILAESAAIAKQLRKGGMVR